MRIGIMTFWWSEDNYGQLLQCYALQKYLRDLGHDAYLIRYDPRDDIVKTNLLSRLLKALNPAKLFRFCKIKIIKIKSNNEYSLHPRHFDEFRSVYINQSDRVYTSYKQLRDNPPEADVYIAGSDQIWNFYGLNLNKCKNILHAYFLDFGSERIKRISYAASWGKCKLNEDFIKEIQPLLARFSAVTVREKNGTVICGSCGIKYAEWVCDPTLLLSVETYRKLYNEIVGKEIHKPYVLFYYLGNDASFSVQSVYDWAKKKNIDIKYVTGNAVIDRKTKVYPTIQEWLRLIDNAEYVITNSFHCCAFSIMFHKKFVSIPLTGENAGMNERIDSLFKMFEISPRYLIDNDFSCIEKYYENTTIERYNLNRLLLRINNAQNRKR
jgi:hypothetical protein